jgi:hypothetical protein
MLNLNKYAHGQSKWLTQADLQQPAQLVTIKKTTEEAIGNPPTIKLCLHFYELAKPYGANCTAVGRLITAYGDDESQLIGKQVIV